MGAKNLGKKFILPTKLLLPVSESPNEVTNQIVLGVLKTLFPSVENG